MATLQEVYDLRFSTNIRNRTTAACWAAAEDIRNEDPTRDHHLERNAWAAHATQDDGDGPVVQGMIRLLVQNPTIQTKGEDSLDSEIQFTVNGLVDFFALTGTYGA